MMALEGLRKHAQGMFSFSLCSDHSLRSCPKSAVAVFVEQGSVHLSGNAI
jgi:hypothetical protein